MRFLVQVKGSGNGNKLSECEFQETWIQVFGKIMYFKNV